MKLKKYTKYVLTFPQVLIHRLRGIAGSYDELVTFSDISLCNDKQG